MSLSAGRVDQVLDLFAPLGDLSTRRMMGGVCIYHDGTIFAIVMRDGGLWLKATGPMVAEVAAAACTRWSYARADGRQIAMPYWSMPDGAEDDPEIACDWARRTLACL